MLKPDWSSRDRTIVHLIPAVKYLEQKGFSDQLFPAAKIVDWRSHFVERARPKQRRLGLTVAGELSWLRRIGDSERRVFSVINTEYMVARFSEKEREQFWLGLWSDFPHLKGIVIFNTLNAPSLLPNSVDLQSWEKAGRLIIRDSK